MSDQGHISLPVIMLRISTIANRRPVALYYFSIRHVNTGTREDVAKHRLMMRT